MLGRWQRRKVKICILTLIYWEFSYEGNVFIEQCLAHVVALCEVHVLEKNLVPMMHNNPELVILVKFSHGYHVPSE